MTRALIQPLEPPPRPCFINLCMRSKSINRLANGEHRKRSTSAAIRPRTASRLTYWPIGFHVVSCSACLRRQSPDHSSPRQRRCCPSRRNSSRRAVRQNSTTSRSYVGSRNQPPSPRAAPTYPQYHHTRAAYGTWSVRLGTAGSYRGKLYVPDQAAANFGMENTVVERKSAEMRIRHVAKPKR